MADTEGEPTNAAESSQAPASGTDVAASMATAPDATAGDPPATDWTNTPEYKALQEQNRVLARQAGSARAEAERLKQERIAQQEAAEAQRVAEIQQQMASELGDNAPAFAEYAQLLNTDPVAAARKFAEMTQAQSPVLPSEPSEATQQEDQVPINEQRQQMQSQQPAAPQPPQRGVSATTPLGQTQQQSQDDRLAALDQQVNGVVEQNQNLSTRARVTDKMRSTAMGQFLQSQYLRAMGDEPELDLNQRRR